MTADPSAIGIMEEGVGARVEALWELRARRQQQNQNLHRSRVLRSSSLLVIGTVLVAALVIASTGALGRFKGGATAAGSLLSAGEAASRSTVTGREKQQQQQPQLSQFTPLRVEQTGSVQPEANGQAGIWQQQAAVERMEGAKMEADKAKAAMGLLSQVFGMQPALMVAVPPSVRELMLRSVTDLDELQQQQQEQQQQREQQQEQEQQRQEQLGDVRTADEALRTVEASPAWSEREGAGGARMQQAYQQASEGGGHEFREDVRIFSLTVFSLILVFCLLVACRLACALGCALKEELEEDSEEEEEEESRTGDSENDEEQGWLEGVQTTAADTLQDITQLAQNLCWVWPAAACAGLLSMAGVELDQEASADVVISAGRLRKEAAYCGSDAVYVLQTWLEAKGLRVHVLPTAVDEELAPEEVEAVLLNSLLFIALIDDAWVEDESENNLQTLALAYHCTSQHQRPAVFVYHDPDFRYFDEISGRSHELGTHNCATMPKVVDAAEDSVRLDALLHSLRMLLPDEEAQARPRIKVGAPNVDATPRSRESKASDDRAGGMTRQTSMTGARSIEAMIKHRVLEKKRKLDVANQAKASMRRSPQDRDSGPKMVMQPTYLRPPISFQSAL